MALAADAAHGIQVASSPAHEPLGVRVVACLEACRSVIGLELVGEDDLTRLRTATRSDEMYQAAKALDTAIAAVGEQLLVASGGARGIKVRRLKDLRSEMLSLTLEIQRGFLDQQQSMLQGIGDSLRRLSSTDSTSALIERATQEVCRSCGVDRCALFRTNGATLIVESVHFAGDSAFQEEWLAFAQAHPPELHHQDAEVQALRRRIPVIVDDPADLEGMREVIEAGHSTSYAVAPVIVRSSVIGLIHVDRYFSGLGVDPAVRDAVATFAAGLGYALERNALIDRTKSQLARMREMISEVENSMEDLFYGGISLRREERGVVDPTERVPVVALPAESRLSGLLTRRELEVMELMARGSSNNDIAERLVISEGTVKSHVKHILRKLHAANRAQAVSTYMRVQTGPSHP
jgi:LuxR family transcriptional regulator, regulator of acetate metabolism